MKYTGLIRVGGDWRQTLAMAKLMISEGIVFLVGCYVAANT